MFIVKCFLPTTSRAEKKTFVMYSQKFPNIGTHYRQNHKNSTVNLSVRNANLAQFKFDVYDSDRPEICVRRRAAGVRNINFHSTFTLVAFWHLDYMPSSGSRYSGIFLAKFGIFSHFEMYSRRGVFKKNKEESIGKCFDRRTRERPKLAVKVAF